MVYAQALCAIHVASASKVSVVPRHTRRPSGQSVDAEGRPSHACPRHGVSDCSEVCIYSPARMVAVGPCCRCSRLCTGMCHCMPGGLCATQARRSLSWLLFSWLLLRPMQWSAMMSAATMASAMAPAMAAAVIRPPPVCRPSHRLVYRPRSLLWCRLPRAVSA